MNQTKSIFLSKTFWGIALTALATVGPKFGIHITNDDATLQILLQLVGSAVALYGRMKATQGVHIVTPSNNAQQP